MWWKQANDAGDSAAGWDRTAVILTGVYVRLTLTLLEKLRERAGRGTNFGTARTGLVTVRAAARTRDWQSVQTGSTDSNAGLMSADAVVEAAAACC